MWDRNKSTINCESKENNSKEYDNNNKKYKSGRNFDKIFESLSGFQLVDLTSFEKFVKLLYRPTDPSSLGVARALFGKKN